MELALGPALNIRDDVLFRPYKQENAGLRNYTLQWKKRVCCVHGVRRVLASTPACVVLGASLDCVNGILCHARVAVLLAAASCKSACQSGGMCCAGHVFSCEGLIIAWHLVTQVSQQHQSIAQLCHADSPHAQASD